MDIEVLDAELIKCTLTRDGISVSAYVTSHHLTEQKRAQLEAAITKEALRAFNP